MTVAPPERAWCRGDVGLTSSGRALAFEVEWRTQSRGCGGLGAQGGQTGRAQGLRADSAMQTDEGKGHLNTGGRAAMPVVLVRQSLRAEGRGGRAEALLCVRWPLESDHG